MQGGSPETAAWTFNSGHADQSLFLRQVFVLTQWSGSREVSHQGHNLGSGELNGCDGLSRRALGRALGTRGGGLRGGPRNRGLLLLPFIARGSLSKSFRDGGESEDTRDVYQLLHSGADTKEEIGVHRGTLSGRCEESVGDGVGGECQDTRCQSIRVNVQNGTSLGHQPQEPGVDILKGLDGGAQIITESIFCHLETNGIS